MKNFVAAITIATASLASSTSSAEPPSGCSLLNQTIIAVLQAREAGATEMQIREAYMTVGKQKGLDDEVINLLISAVDWVYDSPAEAATSVIVSSENCQ